MTNTGTAACCLHAQQDLALARYGPRDLLRNQRFQAAELV
jgi:hypothetical protein